MKSIGKLIMAVAVLTCVALLVGCGKDTDKDGVKDWLSNARLDAPDARDTPNELYKLALDEGILTIYSTSTRMVDVAKSFEKQYPGLTVKVLDMRPTELIDMLRTTVDEQVYDCDIVTCSDGDGVMSRELLPEGYIFKYVPQDIKDRFIEGNDGELLTLMQEAIVFAYSDAVYTEPPVDNWWELTEEQWRGKVLMPNPTRSVTTFAFLAMFIKHEQEMAKAYADRYGKELETLPGEGAGKTFIRRLVENGLVLVNSSDEVAEGVGAPGIQENMVGIMVSSKLRMRDLGYTVQISEQMKPFVGVLAPSSIMIAGGAKNINAAKLFIRWIFGEADGQGEGYRPYLQNGAWSVRSDVRSDSEKGLDEMNMIYFDSGFIYDNKDGLLGFWEGLMKEK